MPQLLKWELESLQETSRRYRIREKQLKRAARHTNLPGYAFAREQLHIWRTVTHRREARAASLAYGFLKGRNYWEMEERCHEMPEFDRVKELVFELSVSQPVHELNDWIKEARAYLKAYPPTSHNLTPHEPASLPEMLMLPAPFDTPIHFTFELVAVKAA